MIAPPLSPSCPVLASLAAGLASNTLVVLAAVAAVGCASGVVGSLVLLRKRPLLGDAAAHATLVGAAATFLLTGRRDLPTLLAGAAASALAGLILLAVIRRSTRTRDDAATAIVIGVSFGAGVAVVAWMTARGLPGSGTIEQLLLGHAAALTVRDAALLAVVSLLVVGLVVAALKEIVAVAFDADFSSAVGWPVPLIDALLAAVVVLMVVVGLPTAGAVLVSALLVIPPVAARQWSDRVGPLLAIAGLMGLAAAVLGVAASAWRPGVPTGPAVVLAAAALCLVSILFAPGKGLVARRWGERNAARRWARGRVLEECLAVAGGDGLGPFDARHVLERAAGGHPAARRGARWAWAGLIREAAVEPLAAPAAGRERWRLSAAGRDEAHERRRRIDAWRAILDAAPENGRDGFTLDLPMPDAVSAVGPSSPPERMP